VRSREMAGMRRRRKKIVRKG